MQERLAFALLLVGAFGSSGCDQQAQAAPDPRAKTPEPAPVRVNQRAQSYAKLTPFLTRHDELPARIAERRCADELIAREIPDESDRALLLRVQDARLEKKSVLPLRITRAVSSVDLGELEAQVTREETGKLDPRISARIDWLASRRFVGVFHVIDYSPPYWIHRLDRVKSEWVAGWLTTWFVIHDAKTGEPLCSTRLTVKNDTTGAPLQRKLRSETAERLSAELGTELRTNTRQALARISSALRVEDAPRNP